MIVKISSECSKCGETNMVAADISPVQLAPVVRSGLKPESAPFKYRITSDQIKRYLIDKGKRYAPDVNMEVRPRFIEKKKRKAYEPHRSYASIRIAFSENVIEKNKDLGWFGKIGESDNIRIVQSIFQQFIRMYSYDRGSLKKIRNDYKHLEEVEECFGMTEAYLDDLIEFSSPKLIKSSTNKLWVIFAAPAEKVIQDMLTIAETGIAPGRIEIKDTVQLSKDSVEYIVYVYQDRVVTEDPSVRRILLGEEKVK